MVVLMIAALVHALMAWVTLAGLHLALVLTKVIAALALMKQGIVQVLMAEVVLAHQLVAV